LSIENQKAARKSAKSVRLIDAAVYGEKDLLKRLVLACNGRVKECLMKRVVMVKEMKAKKID